MVGFMIGAAVCVVAAVAWTRIRRRISDVQQSDAAPSTDVLSIYGSEGADRVAASFKLPTPELLDGHYGEADSDHADSSSEIIERLAHIVEELINDDGISGNITNRIFDSKGVVFHFESPLGSLVNGYCRSIEECLNEFSARVSSPLGGNQLIVRIPFDQRDGERYKVEIAELLVESCPTEGQSLPVILGRDMDGIPVVADLTEMRHLVVAGGIGTGKSVAIDSLILSLIWHRTPLECRLVIIEQYGNEFGVYQNIPHLLEPIVTDCERASGVLRWIVGEIGRRRTLLSGASARNITSYNEKSQNSPISDIQCNTLPYICIFIESISYIGKNKRDSSQDDYECLIYILKYGKYVGIHLVYGASENDPILDDLLQENCSKLLLRFIEPARLESFIDVELDAYPSAVGDAILVSSPSEMSLIRLAIADDETRQLIAEHWAAQSGLSSALPMLTKSNELLEPDERKYRQVCQLVFESQKASASWLQRQMGVGYKTASRWIERMEADGFVGSMNDAGRREIYRDRDGGVL